MRKALLGITFLSIGLIVLNFNPPKTYGEEDALLKEADQFWKEKSYQLAIPKYRQILDPALNLSKEQILESRFKLGDSLWRVNQNDPSDESRKILKEIIEEKDKGRWQAEACESLALYYLKRDVYSHDNEINQYLTNARDYWAGTSTDIDLARVRFIEASFTLGDYLSQRHGWYYMIAENQGLNILYEGILKVAKDPEHKAKAHYGLAMSYLNRNYDAKGKDLVKKHFTEVIDNFTQSEWADDAYYQLGQSYERDNDFVKAVEVYQKFLDRFRQGQSQWMDDVRSRVKDITSPQINLGVGYTFLPESEIQFSLGWRNVDKAQFTLYRIDLVKELQTNTSKQITDSEYGVDNYQELIKNLVESNRYSLLPIERTWNQTLKDEKKHIVYNENKGLAEWQKPEDKKEVDGKSGILPAGAYLLLVKAADKKVYDLILVTDMGLVVKTAGQSALFYAFNGKTGEPKAKTRVKYQYRYYGANNNWLWEEGQGETDERGIFNVRLKNDSSNNNQHNLFVTASDGTHQAFSQGNYYDYRNSNLNNGAFWLYAFSDRPAYRPNEEVSFKGIMRKYDGAAFSNPANLRLKAEIRDPRGNIVYEKIYTLNDYGSFDDHFMLKESDPLGEYRMIVRQEDNSNVISEVTLFRLEEYKLPEFLVNIKPTPKEKKEGPASYRLGDTVEVEVDAQYYFGGAVADAEVAYLIYQNNYQHSYSPIRKYAWYYDEQTSRNYYSGRGQLLKQEKIKTDEQGKAHFSFETPKDITYDLKYDIEVRVVDKSRREIVSNSSIKVTQHSFYAYLTPQQNLYRPGDKAFVDIKTITANEEPVSVEGKIAVSRNWWNDPSPVVAENFRGHVPNSKTNSVHVPDAKVTPIEGHYSESPLFTRFVKTDAMGNALFEFQPEQDGYYIVHFTGYDVNGSEVEATSNVYVCNKQSQDIGYRYGGLQLIAEKDTYSIGDTARFMIVSDNPGAWVLLSSETSEILDYQMLHLEGPVKLMELPVKDTYAPNVFIDAISAQEYQIKMHELSVIVPPKEKFLNVKIISDKETYNPQKEGTFDIEVTDNDGKPVIGEVALGIVDKSVYYIQSDYAKDIQQYFYGDKRNHSVTTQASFNQRRYMRFVRDENNQLLSEEEQQVKTKYNVTGQTRRDEGDVINNKGSGHLEETLNAPVDQLKRQVNKSLASAQDDSRLGIGGEFAEKKVASIMPTMSSPQSSAVDNEASLVTPQTRTDFRSTMTWLPKVVTDENGKAQVKAKFPDSLTTWLTTARVINNETRVGNVTHEVKTKTDLIVRLQAPRFFVERDQVTISANVHNYTDKEQKVMVTVKADDLKILDKPSVWVTVPSEGEKRVDFKTEVSHVPSSGNTKIKMMAQTEDVSDAVEKSFAVIPHGIEKFIANAVALNANDNSAITKEFNVRLPKERIQESTSLELVMSPSIAAAMLDALPYLAQYPYGCVEQTMSRFLPTVIVAKTLKDLGLKESDIARYISDVLEPSGDPKIDAQSFDKMTFKNIEKMTKDGLNRLYDFQHNDGGWGWWKEDSSDRFMSAYVVWGMAMAKEAGTQVNENALRRGITFLQSNLVEEENNPDMLAWILHALSTTRSSSEFETKQIERLWEMRNDLNPYTRALFALSAFNRKDLDRAQVLARNLANGILEDKDNATAHWGEAGVSYRWSEGGVEATAFSIKALSNIDPQSAYLEQAVKWLALNRRGARWKNTRDTSIAILGLADYLKTTAQLNPEYSYEIFVNGKSVRKGQVTKDNVLSFSRKILLPNEDLSDGDNQVKVAFNGKGALFLVGYLKYFTLEEDITPAGNEVFVERQISHKSTKETLMKGYVEDWKPLKSGDTLQSGDRIKVDIMLEAKNHYEYLVVEDYKPAGFEAVELKSGSVYFKGIDNEGHDTDNTVWSYQEFRDQKVAFFITKLPQGKYKISYELRAEIPGEFHGMPNQTHAMYVPEIRANSSELRLNVTDKE